YYIIPIILWALMVVVLIATASNRHHSREYFVFVCIFAGIASAIIAFLLALSRTEVAIGFGVFAIIHGLGQPFLMWPNIDFNTLLMPAISIVIGLRALMIMRKKV